ncbi:alpha-L-rhamnosidase-related protein [Aeromicrobium sp.]|uniref:alpha-L-rhamnosidase-related protein n=1 Tax=Aeromicrobium sp. TaxID=1871063 RepID=UPI002FC7A890
MFRRRFAVDAQPTTAIARLTADSRYVLWVNGREVGRGPVRSQPRRLRYDEHDLAEFLVPGDNAVALLVTYYGKPNSWWQPAVRSGIGGDAGFVFEARIGDTLLISDDEWKAQDSPAWSEAADTTVDNGIAVESLDSRLLPTNWLDTDFDDSNWSRALILKAGHFGGLQRSRPPVNPYGALEPRPIGTLGGETVTAKSVVDSSTHLRPSWTTGHPVDRVRQVLVTDFTWSPGTLPIRAELMPGQVQHVAVDFGRIVAGFVEVDLDVPSGTYVELLYREWPFNPAKVSDFIGEPRAGAQYIARNGAQTYASVELNGLRFLHMLIHSPDGGPVAVHRVAVREYTYPRSGDAYFRSSDPELDRIYTAGIRTVELNSFDAFTDCPTREQRAWVGDGVVHQMVHMTTNTDWRLARWYVELSDSPRYDGILPMSVAGDVEDLGQFTIPDWSLHWVHGVHNLFRFDDAEAVRRHLPTVERILRWYLPYVDEHGTLTDVPEWNLADWSSVSTNGRSSILTALWARGLREFAEMSEFLGNSGSAQWALGYYDSARTGFEDFWDSARGLYVDHYLDGTKMPAVSQVANASAIVSKLAPAERWKDIADRMTDRSRLVESLWIDESEEFDETWMLEKVLGARESTWDVHHQVVRAQPFFSYVVHDALAAAGLFDRLLDAIRDWSRFLKDGYDTFGECWEGGTPVHGWSSTPTRDLLSYIVGISPREPGYASARVAPQPHVLADVEGAVPTPHGLLTVKISGRDVTVDSPVPVQFIDPDLGELLLPAGFSTLTLGRGIGP